VLGSAPDKPDYDFLNLATLVERVESLEERVESDGSRILELERRFEALGEAAYNYCTSMLRGESWSRNV